MHENISIFLFSCNVELVALATVAIVALNLNYSSGNLRPCVTTAFDSDHTTIMRRKRYKQK